MNTKSNGLGLSISQRIAQALSGKISVTSEMGVGSTFTFEFTAKKVNIISQVSSKYFTLILVIILTLFVLKKYKKERKKDCKSF